MKFKKRIIKPEWMKRCSGINCDVCESRREKGSGECLKFNATERPADLPEDGESAKRIANTLYEVRTDGLCFICRKPTQNLSPDPSKWRIDLPFNGGNGLTRQYHQGCIVELIHKHFG